MVKIKPTNPKYLVNWKIWTDNRIGQAEQDFELKNKF